jgi:hypothetical protein
MLELHGANDTQMHIVAAGLQVIECAQMRIKQSLAFGMMPIATS